MPKIGSSQTPGAALAAGTAGPTEAASPAVAGSAGRPGRGTLSLASSLGSSLLSKLKPRNDGTVPERLREKSQELTAKLKHARPELREYARDSISVARNKQVPGPWLTKLDIANLGAIVETENQRHADLNLRVYTDIDSFVAALTQERPTAPFRALFQMPDARSRNNRSLHHTMVDVRPSPSGPPSIVFIEPAVLLDAAGSNTPRYYQTLERMTQAGLDMSRVAVIEAAQQKSGHDCAMFALNSALKASKDPARLAAIHDRLEKGKAVIPGVRRDAAERQTSLGGGAGLRQYFPSAVQFVPGEMALPSEFFKHTHSATKAASVMSQPGSSSEAPAAGAANRRGESLSQRVQAYRTARKPAVNEDVREFSASIDGFRLQEIGRVIDADRAARRAASKPTRAGTGSRTSAAAPAAPAPASTSAPAPAPTSASAPAAGRHGRLVDLFHEERPSELTDAFRRRYPPQGR